MCVCVCVFMFGLMTWFRRLDYDCECFSNFQGPFKIAFDVRWWNFYPHVYSDTGTNNIWFESLENSKHREFPILLTMRLSTKKPWPLTRHIFTFLYFLVVLPSHYIILARQRFIYQEYYNHHKGYRSYIILCQFLWSPKYSRFSSKLLYLLKLSFCPTINFQQFFFVLSCTQCKYTIIGIINISRWREQFYTHTKHEMV